MDRTHRGLGITAITVVIVGSAVALVLGLAAGMDKVAIVLFGSVIGAGFLVVAAVGRMGSGTVAPGHCVSCGGLISPNAPYCKHCGETTV